MGSCLGNTSKLPTEKAHRCKHVYFLYKKTQRSQVLESLGCYQTDIDLINITDIIMDYIPNDHHPITPIESSDGDKGYNIYYHSSRSLCPVWPKKFVDKQIKVRIVGDKGIGKTSLIKRFTTNRFTEDYHDPTIDNFKKEIVIDNQQCMLDIADYAGQQMIYSNSLIADHILRSGQIFICCFAIDSVKSFEKALIDRKRIIRCKEGDNNWSIMLVATKCDLMDNTMDLDEKKVVNTNKVIEQAKQWNIGYIETSAKYGINVNHLFERSILEYWIQSENHKYCDQPLRSQAIKPINL